MVLMNYYHNPHPLSTHPISYLHELRQRPDVFAADSLAVIFANIEQIWLFQQGFVQALRLAVLQNRIAETFVEYVSILCVRECAQHFVPAERMLI